MSDHEKHQSWAAGVLPTVRDRSLENLDEAIRHDVPTSISSLSSTVSDDPDLVAARRNATPAEPRPVLNLIKEIAHAH